MRWANALIDWSGRERAGKRRKGERGVWGSLTKVRSGVKSDIKKSTEVQ